jgi:ATP-binding cassette, subfamily A (ABC1), member 3
VVFDTPHNFSNELKFTLRFPSTPKHAANDPMRPIKTWWTQFTFPLFARPGPRMSGNETGGVPGYYEEGFLAVQHAISMIVAAKVANNDQDINDDVLTLQMLRFPYPDYVEDDFLLALQFLFPFILMLSFIYPAVNLTKNLVIEKEKRLKESMKMMGLKNWLHWLAWFIKSFLWLALSVGLLSILITIKVKDGVGIMNKSDGLLIYLFFITYTISSIAFCFMLSTFFSKVSKSEIYEIIFFLYLEMLF